MKGTLGSRARYCGGMRCSAKAVGPLNIWSISRFPPSLHSSTFNNVAGSDIPRMSELSIWGFDKLSAPVLEVLAKLNVLR